MDSRLTMSKWLLLVAALMLWGAVILSAVAGVGVSWVTLVLAVAATAMAAYVWLRLR